MYIFTVVIKTPLYATFDYQSSQTIVTGARVKVNFAGREVIALIFASKQYSIYKLKNIIQVIDETPLIDTSILALIRQCATYYMQPIGEVAFAALPKKLRLGNELKIKKPILKAQQHNTKIVLNNEQDLAVTKVCESLNIYQAFLLHGITGSGKTEVYLQIAKQVLLQHKQVLVLVPEIGLTPQMIERFSSRLNTVVVAIHSGLNQTQRLDSFTTAMQGKCGVVLGTRSAIWTQLPNLGLIIVDEEHDLSFKQQSSPRYNAKGMSFMRAKSLNIPLILGSATPSLETLKLLNDKKVIHLMLKSRASGSLPTVSMVDTRHETTAISAQLQVKIKQTLASNKQVMIFINRRGYAPIYYCTSCKWQMTCKACEKPMIYHRDSHKLKCHSCETTIQPMTHCENCGSYTLQVLGYGTQRLEDNLSAKFNGVDIVRIDRDSTLKKNELNKKLARIKTGKPCIIIGTQMLAKGHDFAAVTLVGVLNVDGSLLSSRFRASEHLMQLLIQVTGRAGRAKDKGEVFIQTQYADYPIFNFIQYNNYFGFAKNLLLERKNALMPPFSHQALICANSKVAKKSQNYLLKCKQILDRIDIDEVNIFSVIEANTYKKADYYYYHLNLYSQNRTKLVNTLHTFLQHIPKTNHGVRWFIDVDPLD